MRPSLATALLAAVLALAPAVSAQSPASMPLTPTVGSPIAYRVDLPTGWKTLNRDDEMLVVGSERLMIIVGATDLMKGEENPLPVSQAETRRIMTSMVLGSDSLLLGLLGEAATAMQKDAELRDVVTGIRTLGGQKSGYLQGRLVGKEPGRFEMSITLKDGIMYMVAFGAQGDGLRENEPLLARVRDSLVFAPAPK
jgi:hypothetical protein